MKNILKIGNLEAHAGQKVHGSYQVAGTSLTMPVTLIASKAGYENFTNFSQMFRKVMGVTPTEYRKINTKP